MVQDWYLFSLNSPVIFFFLMKQFKMLLIVRWQFRFMGSI
jgi:hypothetical protein